MFEHLLHMNMRFFLSIYYIRKYNMAEPMLHTKIWYLSVSALFLSVSALFFFTYENV